MLKKKAMTEKHIQIARNCVRKAKAAKRRERRKYWLNLATHQLKQAEVYAEVIPTD